MEEEKFTPRKLLLFIVEMVLAVIFILSAVSLVQMYWISPIGVSGCSMEDTLFTGDTVYINKAYKTIERGDVVVVFLPQSYDYATQWGLYTGENDDTQRCPSSRTKTFDDFVQSLPFFGKANTHDDTVGGTVEDDYYMVIKRVVACPGDVVQILDGVLTVNGERDARAGLFNYPNDYYHVMLEGEYYILGDNRANSRDSSRYGPVRGSWILGKVVLAHTHNHYTTKL